MLAARARRLRNGGQSDRYHHAEFGVNSRLDEIQAAVLHERLAFLPRWTERRRTLAARYRTVLAGVDTIAVPPQLDAGHVYHLFPILSGSRDALQAHLRAAGVETLIHYPVPIPNQPALASTAPADCPVANRICGEHGRFELEGISVLRVLDREYALAATVATSAFLGRRPLALAGAHPVDDDPEAAGAFAALKSVNRLLGWIARLGTAGASVPLRAPRR